MKTEEERAQAVKMFVEEGKTLQQIADHFGVSQAAVALWSSGGNWKGLRRERRFMTAHPALDALRRELDLQVQKVGKTTAAEPAQIEALNKLHLMVEKMESRVDPIGPMLEAMGRFARFVAARAEREDRVVIHKWVERFFNEERRKNS